MERSTRCLVWWRVTTIGFVSDRKRFKPCEAGWGKVFWSSGDMAKIRSSESSRIVEVRTRMGELGGGLGGRDGDEVGRGTEMRSGPGEFWLRRERIFEESGLSGGEGHILLRG